MYRLRPAPSLELLVHARRKIPSAGLREAWCILSPAMPTIRSAGRCAYSPPTTQSVDNLGMRRRAHYLLRIRWLPSKVEIFRTYRKFRKAKHRPAAKSSCFSEFRIIAKDAEAVPPKRSAGPESLAPRPASRSSSATNGRAQTYRLE